MRIMGFALSGKLIKEILSGAIVIDPLPKDAEFLYMKESSLGVAYYFKSDSFDEFPEGGEAPVKGIMSYDITHWLTMNERNR